jgi:hypothetical protein
MSALWLAILFGVAIVLGFVSSYLQRTKFRKDGF